MKVLRSERRHVLPRTIGIFSGAILVYLADARRSIPKTALYSVPDRESSQTAGKRLWIAEPLHAEHTATAGITSSDRSGLCEHPSRATSAALHSALHYLSRGVKRTVRN